MKKEDLITALQALPDGAEICINGYEGGVNSEFSVSEPIEVVWEHNSDWYYGSHEEYREYKGMPKGTPTVTVYVLR